MFTAQKMKFSTKDFFGKCDQILNGNLLPSTVVQIQKIKNATLISL